MTTNKGGRPKKPPTPRIMLKNVIPANDMFEEDELEIYNSLVDLYLDDFKNDDLSSSDLDDILSLATNKVLEIRLLKASKGNPSLQISTSTTVDRLRKNNDKIKENLSARRKDRIDPNELKGFSIVDLAVSFDESKKLALEKKAREKKKSQAEVAEELAKYGNKDDKDGDVK